MATLAGAKDPLSSVPRGLPAWVFVGLFLLAGLAGFVIGTQRSDVVELIGRAQVGHHMASIESGGWWYGLSDSVAWVDANGTFNEDGWPDCLGRDGTVTTVRFGAVPVSYLGAGWRAVVFVDCRPV